MKIRLETMVNSYNVRSKKPISKRVQILDGSFNQTTTNLSTTNKEVDNDK